MTEVLERLGNRCENVKSITFGQRYRNRSMVAGTGGEDMAGASDVGGFPGDHRRNCAVAVRSASAGEELGYLDT
jgi:hypothetical protein